MRAVASKCRYLLLSDSSLLEGQKMSSRNVLMELPLEGGRDRARRLQLANYGRRDRLCGREGKGGGARDGSAATRAEERAAHPALAGPNTKGQLRAA